MVICELLGVPYEEREGFQRDTGTALSLNKSFDEIRAALERVQEFVADLARRKRDEPGDDMIGMANSALQRTNSPPRYLAEHSGHYPGCCGTTKGKRRQNRSRLRMQEWHRRMR